MLCVAQGQSIGYGVRQGEGGLTVWLHNVGERGYVRSIRLLGIYRSVQGVDKKQRMKGWG